MSTIVISYDGTDITDDVVLQSASFTSQVNGNPGPCTFKVKDPNRDKSFTTGKIITLDIDGDRRWSGYLTSVSRVYAFDDHSPLTRFLLLQGTDINILLHKRFVFHQSTPTRMLGPIYGAATADTTAIADLVDDWLDLSGDSLDTSSLVDNIGNINVDQAANVWQAGWEWNAAMATIARLTQAVWYLKPDRKLVYTDVDTVTAAVELSDIPTGGRAGYREFTLDFNGSQMINDALVWGVGGGSPAMVFQRKQDASSISEHGLWQVGQVYAGVWKQATLDKIADSIVIGSPLSKRGGRMDRVSAELTTYEQSFLPAQKVNLFSHAFGWSDVIPIRKMEITFPTQTDAKFRLTLSHEIDLPFSGYDAITIKGINPNVILIGGIDIPPVVVPPTTGCECGITDAFDRTVVGGWGTSDSSLPWTLSTSTAVTSVDGSVGIAVMTGGAGQDFKFGTYRAPGWIDDVLSGTVDFWVDAVPSGATADIVAIEFRGAGWTFICRVSSNATVGKLTMAAPFNSSTFVKTDWVAATWYRMRWLYDHANNLQAMKVWLRTDPEPGSWTTTRTTSTDIFVAFAAGFQLTVGPPSGGSATIMIDNLDITGLNRCTEFRFDNFERTTSTGSWGSNDDGFPWSLSSSTASLDVTGTQGRITLPSTSGLSAPTASISDVVWAEATGFTMLAAFTFFGGVPTGTQTLLVAFNIVDNADPFNTIFIQFSIRNTGSSQLRLTDSNASSNAFANKTDWVSDQEYFIRWEHDPTIPVSRMRIWPSNTTEPSTWDVSIAVATVPAATSFLQILANGDPRTSGLVRGFKFNWVDFVYNGEPCFEECSEDDLTLIDADEFNRSVSLGETWGQSEFSGGPLWEDQLPGTTQGTASVDGNVAKMVTLNSFPNGATFQQITGFDIQFPLVIEVKFRLHAIVGANPSLSITFSNSFSELFAFVSASLSASVPEANFVAGGLDDDNNSYDFTIDNPLNDDVWYIVKVSWASNVTKVKLWDADDPEPDDWNGETTHPLNIHELSRNNRMQAQIGGTNLGAGSYGHIDYIRFYSGCTTVGPGSGTGVSPSHFCEDITISGSPTTITLTTAYEAGTTEVYFDGLRAAYGVDYFETDAVEGLLTFAAPITADVVRVCYRAYTQGGGAGGGGQVNKVF